MRLYRIEFGLLGLIVACVMAGCNGARTPANNRAVETPIGSVTVRPWPIEPVVGTASTDLKLAAAGNEWTSLTVEIAGLPAAADGGQLALSLSQVSGPSTLTLGPDDLEVYEIADLPVDVNRASAIRHSGQLPATARLPRALLSLKQDHGRFLLPTQRWFLPANGLSTSLAVAGGGRTALRAWFDVRIPANPVAGNYQFSLQVQAHNPGAKPTDPPAWKPVASLPVDLTVHAFSLPSERNLALVGQVSWESLVRHFTEDFEAVTPHLLNRNDKRYAGTVQTLDALQRLAQRNRVSVNFPKLQPSVKWPALVNGAQPEIFWDDYDALVGPWLTGKAFGEGRGVGYWPIPEPERLRSYDAVSRLAYWSAAASHFDQMNWLGLSAVEVPKETAGRVRGAEAIELSIQAAQLLDAHPRLTVLAPMEPQQVQLAEAAMPSIGGGRLIDPARAGRLRVAANGLISTRGVWPTNVPEPRRWMRTDPGDLMPGATLSSREHDLRQWAWLAFLRRADLVYFAQALPLSASAEVPADPSDLTWFYPGKWFGRDEPVPSIQLKYLRKAEQDYEYLYLAKLKGETVNAIWMSRLLTKPVEVGIGQSPDDAYALMTGTADPAVWAEARALLAKVIELYADRPDGRADHDAKDTVEIEILQWARPQERPLLLGRTADWAWKRQQNGADWIELNLGLDVYNNADVTPGDNRLQWTGQMARGWEVRPQPVVVPPLKPFNVLRTGLSASYNLSKTAAGASNPMELELTVDSPTARFASPLKIALPVVSSDRRQEGRFSFDGKLDDWIEADLIHDGPLVKMLSRPAVLSQSLEYASTRTRLYTNWHTENFYVGFALAGVTKPDPSGTSAKNFVEYESRRAWGEDLCEVLVQPVYRDNTLGPILHIVCKPNGSSWIERKLDPLLNANPWQPMLGAGVRYAATVVGENWTGEVGVPWSILQDPKHGMPTLLRFNFSQHRAATGESASWAGPVDFGRDDALTGLIHLKLPIAGNGGDAVQGDAPGSGVFER